jgi:hypothetical protein
MKSVFKSIVLCLYLAISMSACAQDETSTVLIKEYETCCGADAVEVAVGEKEKLYIPNSFTPNKDGKNDVFRPFYTGDITYMTYMLFYSLEGDTLLYVLDGQEFNSFEKGKWGWDGTRTGEEPLYAGDWKLHKGGFRYEIAILTEEEGYIYIKGKACAIHCGADASVFKDNAACFFPSQVNEDGTFNPQIAHNDSDCFK